MNTEIWRTEIEYLGNKFLGNGNEFEVTNAEDVQKLCT